MISWTNQNVNRKYVSIFNSLSIYYHYILYMSIIHLLYLVFLHKKRPREFSLPRSFSYFNLLTSSNNSANFVSSLTNFSSCCETLRSSFSYRLSRSRIALSLWSMCKLSLSIISFRGCTNFLSSIQTTPAQIPPNTPKTKVSSATMSATVIPAKVASVANNNINAPPIV